MPDVAVFSKGRSVSDQQPKLPNRQMPFSEAFTDLIWRDWTPYDSGLPDPLPATAATAARRHALAALFPGERLVVPAGGLKVRSNDTDHRFRPHSAFAHLTGLGTDREPDAVLVLEPTDDGAVPTLFFNPRAARTDEEFYASSRYGEMWVGRRESLDEMAALSQVPCAPLSTLPDALAKNADSTRLRVVRGASAQVTAMVDEIRAGQAASGASAVAGAAEADDEFETAVSELRLVKDAFEIEQLRAACEATAVGFEAVIAGLPEAVRRGRGERWVEGLFGLHARHLGNAAGYDTIAASGDHANTLHWIRNDGDLRPGDLLLLDAGVELDSLYTADVTRTLPVSGRFSPAQRQVYEAVLEAQQAGIDAARPGATFSDIHEAAIAVIARKLFDWGILPVPVADSLDLVNGGHHRRWMVHGTSHHLGLDVHDCAQARLEHYRLGTLEPGMVVTVEPGLYFKSTDLMVPEELRGIGVRIEDDIVITATGNEVLSAMLPRDPDEVEAWLARVIGA